MHQVTSHTPSQIHDCHLSLTLPRPALRARSPVAVAVKRRMRKPCSSVPDCIFECSSLLLVWSSPPEYSPWWGGGGDGVRGEGEGESEAEAEGEGDGEVGCG